MMTSSPGFSVHQEGVVEDLLAAGGDDRVGRLVVEPVLALELGAIASRSGGMPSTGGYLVSPRWIASIAASLMLSGVSKSGSPTESEMTSRPLAFRSRAFCVTAMVAEGLTRERTSARKAI